MYRGSGWALLTGRPPRRVFRAGRRGGRARAAGACCRRGLPTPIDTVALARPMARTNKPLLAFCSAKMCTTWARTADFVALAVAVRTAIGRCGGYFSWMRLTSIRSRSSASFLLER